MRLRRLKDDGVAEFAAYLSNLQADSSLPAPTWLLTDASRSEEVQGGIEIENRAFETRFEAASYLAPRVSTIVNVDRDAGLWAWLALFYFDQICPAAPDGSRKVGEQARYIPLIDISRRYYRHMLLGPVSMYRAHLDHPERLLGLLSSPMDVATSETYRLFIENPSLIACKSIVEVATTLYYDPEGRKLKRGAGSKDAGGCRRLIDFLQQVDCTFDLPALSKEHLAQMLPREFERFARG